MSSTTQRPEIANVKPPKKSKPIINIITAILAIILILVLIIFVKAYNDAINHRAYARPTVALIIPYSSTHYHVSVADVQPSDINLAYFKVIINLNGTTIYATQIIKNSLTPTSDKPSWLTVTFIDLTGNWKLNKGDYFEFKSSIAWCNDMTFELKVLWGADDYPLAEKSFTT